MQRLIKNVDARSRSAAWGEGIRTRQAKRLGTRHGVRQFGFKSSTTCEFQILDSKSTYPLLFSFSRQRISAFLSSEIITKQQRGRWRFPRVLLYFKSFGVFWSSIVFAGRRRCSSQEDIYTRAACSLGEAAINLSSYLSIVPTGLFGNLSKLESLESFRPSALSAQLSSLSRFNSTVAYPFFDTPLF